MEDSTPVEHGPEHQESPRIVEDEGNEPLRAAAGSSQPEPAPTSNPSVNGEVTVEAAAQKEMKELLSNEIDESSSSALQNLFKEHEALKGKVSKLKSLLGRSAKVQRETKVDLEKTSKENERLKAKIQKLAARPSHMDLLQDFEVSLDKAILSVAAPPQQSVGQDTRADHQHDQQASVAAMDSMLMTELTESKQRIAKLEQVNVTLTDRTSTLEDELEQSKQSMESMLNKLSVLELEKRMAVMEAEHAKKEMESKDAESREMQLELSLVNQSAQKAAFRATAGEEALRSNATDKREMQKLRAQVQALTEWAEASNVAKMLAQERVRHLEEQLVQAQQRKAPSEGAVGESVKERILLSQKGSLVIGAGDVVGKSFLLDEALVKTVRPLQERVVLRWSFDLTDPTLDIGFRIVAGANAKGGNVLLKDRSVVGGAGGETDAAFDTGKACTMVWSNQKSWIRPKTVKYQVTAVVVKD